MSAPFGDMAGDALAPPIPSLTLRNVGEYRGKGRAPPGRTRKLCDDAHGRPCKARANANAAAQRREIPPPRGTPGA